MTTSTAAVPGTEGPRRSPVLAAATPLDRGTPRSRTAGKVILAVGLLWTLVPLVWMLLSSFKSKTDVTSPTPTLLFTPTLDNYVGLFTGANNLTPYLLHSVLAAGLSAVLAVVLGALAGYGLAHTRMRGKKHLSVWIISTRMAPIAAVVLPLFLIFRGLGLIDSIPGLVLAYLTFDLPFAIWLMSAFFADLPPSLEESALVAGCSRWQAYWYVVPLGPGHHLRALPGVRLERLRVRAGVQRAELADPPDGG
jgi:multiple sugar transport system permease protein